MKLGTCAALKARDEECLSKCREYVSALGGIPYRIIRYGTSLRSSYGVLMNMGERVIVWDSFTEKFEKMALSEYRRRLIGEVL